MLCNSFTMRLTAILSRTTCRLPERGRIGIFNRSYYEEVLVVRVHPDILRGQGFPEELVDEKNIWKERHRSIVDESDSSSAFMILTRTGSSALRTFMRGNIGRITKGAGTDSSPGRTLIEERRRRRRLSPG